MLYGLLSTYCKTHSHCHCNTVPVNCFYYLCMYTPHTIDPHPGNPTPFLYTRTSLLPEHCVLTDVQQATGRDGQQWITCRSGGQGTRPEIWMGSELVVNSSTANSVTIGLGFQNPNGLYHCSSGQSQREYFSLFFTNSGTKYVRMCHIRSAYFTHYEHVLHAKPISIVG